MGLLNKFECYKEHLKNYLKIKKPYLGSQEESFLKKLSINNSIRDCRCLVCNIIFILFNLTLFR